MPIYATKHNVEGENITILVELDQEPARGRENARGGDDIARKAIATTRDLFGAALQLVDDCSRTTVQGVKKMDPETRPDEFELQFMIKLDSEVGAVVAKAQSGAQLQITLTWKAKDQK